MELIRFDPGQGIIQRPYTLSVMILDRSGSMSQFRYSPVAAVNQHFDVIRKAQDGRIHLCSLVTFADTSCVEIPLTPIQSIRSFESYAPCGNTLLWETVHQVLGEMLKFVESFDSRRSSQIRTVIGVFSDGEDNQSHPIRFPRKLQKVSARALARGFQLLTFGIGIDSKDLARHMGFPTDDAHSVTVEATHAGIMRTSIHMTQTTMGGWEKRETSKT